MNDDFFAGFIMGVLFIFIVLAIFVNCCDTSFSDKQQLQLYQIMKKVKNDKYCIYQKEDCEDLKCYDGIKQWLNQEAE